MKYALKIAEYTIAQQARLLKKLERSKDTQKDFRKGFHNARVNVLRKEARAHHIALAFLRGREMNKVEKPLRALNQGHISSTGLTKTAPNWAKVEELVLKFGKPYFDSEQAILQAFAEFRDGWTVKDATVKDAQA